ncbi:MAG: gliding motility-associated C-terminal domain-containing protein [Bacteroidales bacterium]|nr:gliding motility-associated C-terminal domain-containing protein [Bacteroidales bacterium]
MRLAQIVFTRLVLLLLVVALGVCARAAEIVHDISTSSLVIPASSTDSYVVTGSTTNARHYVLVSSGFHGTITLRDVSMQFSSSGGSVNYSPITIKGQNNCSNLTPVTKVTLILQGYNYISNSGSGRACIQVEQGAQVHIRAINPSFNASGTLCAIQQNSDGGAAIGALNRLQNSSEATGTSPLGTATYEDARNRVTTAGGNVVISSGIITARGGHGAGIGGGYGTYYNGIIFIYGGIVNAYTIRHSAGIGSGCPTGYGVLDNFATNSTTIVLPPAQISAYGATANEFFKLARLGLAGTKTLVYIGDENKPQITVKTVDNEPGIDVYADLGNDTNVLRAYNAVIESGQLDIHRVKFGTTNSSGEFRFNGILQNATTFFTDATCVHAPHQGEPYASSTVTMTNGGVVTLPRIGVDFSIQVTSSVPLLSGYDAAEALRKAPLLKMVYADGEDLTNVTFTMASGASNQFGPLQFFASDSITPIAAPSTLSQGDTIYIAVPLAVGRQAFHYNDVLLISGNKQGGSIGFIRQTVDQWVVNSVEVSVVNDPTYRLPSGKTVGDDGIYFDTIAFGGYVDTSMVYYYSCDGNVYQDTLTVSTSVDSIVAMSVTFIRPLYDTIRVSACESYTWNDTLLTQSGLYVRRYPRLGLSDSVVCLALTIYSPTTTQLYDTACNTYVWEGNEITHSTTGGQPLVRHLTNVHGCDSTVYLHLTIHPYSSFYDERTVCDSFYWHGMMHYSSANRQWDTLNHYGCDSLVVLNLTVNHSTRSFEDTNVCDSYFWHGSEYTHTGWPTWTTVNSQGCDSTVTLHLTVRHSTSSVTDSVVCDSILWNGSRYTSSGLYNYVTFNSQRCDSTARLSLVVNYSNSETVDTSSCDVFTWNSRIYRQSAVDRYYTTNRWGCDSTAILQLTMRYSDSISFDTTVCDNISWSDSSLSQNGVYYFYGQNRQLCDSVFALTLSVLHSSTATFSVTACDSYEWHGDNYKTSSTPHHHTINSVGCDSTEVLQLTIAYSTVGEMYDTACDSYVWYGIEYTQSTSPSEPLVHHLLNADGCDSTLRLHLTIHDSTTTVDQREVCDSLMWHGTMYYSSSTSEWDTTDRWGCDSTVVLHLSIKSSTRYNLDSIVCDSLCWSSSAFTYTYRASTTTSYHLANQQGCDSLLTLNLTVNYSNSSLSDSVVCDSLLWNGQSYTSSGLLHYVSTNIHGCDSTARLNLTVNPSSSRVFGATVCDEYEWHDTLHTQSGHYRYVTQNQWGCDSVETLNLTIHRSDSISLNADVCDSIVWSGQLLNQSGAYYYRGINTRGCDSVAVLSLVVRYSSSTVENATSCDSYAWNRSIYDSSTTATYLTTNAVGCDSVVTLHLVVNYSSHADKDVFGCESAQWAGETYWSSTELTDHLTNVAGCDSTLDVHITVNHHTYDTIRLEACDSLMWHNMVFYNSTVAHHRSTNSQGCDSLVTMMLTIARSSYSVDTVFSCKEYLWHDVVYTSSTSDPVFDTTTMAGCDSVIRLDLTMPSHYKAIMEVEPDFVSNGNMHITARDRSEGDIVWRQWSVNDRIIDYGEKLEYDYPSRYVDSIELRLVVEESEYTCSDTATQWVVFKDAVPYAPNVFTPNDVENNRFKVHISHVQEMELFIYSRSGQQVFHTKDINEPWDGTWQTRGTKCPQAVYTYIVRYRTETSPETQVKTGSVLLLY